MVKGWYGEPLWPPGRSFASHSADVLSADGAAPSLDRRAFDLRRRGPVSIWFSSRQVDGDRGWGRGGGVCGARALGSISPSGTPAPYARSLVKMAKRLEGDLDRLDPKQALNVDKRS